MPYNQSNSSTMQPRTLPQVVMQAAEASSDVVAKYELKKLSRWLFDEEINTVEELERCMADRDEDDDGDEE